MRFIITEIKNEAKRRKIPIIDDVAPILRAIIEDTELPKTELIIDSCTSFYFYDENGKPLVAMH